MTLGVGLISGIFFLTFVPNAVNLTIIGILIVMLAIPWRFFIDYLGWLGIPVVMVILELLHPPHWQRRDIDYSFAILWVFEVGLLIVAAILLKAIVYLAWAKWRGVPVFAEFLPRPGRMQATQRRALALCWGVITAFLAYLMIRRTLGEGSHPPFAYASILIFTVSLWLLPWAQARWRSRPKAGGFLTGRAFLESFRWSMLGAVVLGTGLAGLVAREAGELAGDQPHCIQVADSRRNYREAATLSDLSALTMKGHGQRHALLVVGDEPARRVYNWSYRQLGFEELPGSRSGSLTGFVSSCETQIEFIARLPLAIPEATGWTPLYFAGRQYRIPDEFRPKVDGAYGRTLRINATAPEFQADVEAPDYGPGVLRRSISVSLSPWPAIDRWVKLGEGEEIVSVENWAGLVKQTISRPDPYSNWVRFVARDGEGAYQAVINGCQPTTAENPSLCQHRVQRGEALFTFYHSPDDLENWQALQGRLFALFDSFEAAAAERDDPS